MQLKAKWNYQNFLIIKTDGLKRNKNNHKRGSEVDRAFDFCGTIIAVKRFRTTSI